MKARKNEPIKTNAIAENASYKETVKDDMEFLKYYNNPNFQNAIK